MDLKSEDRQLLLFRDQKTMWKQELKKEEAETSIQRKYKSLFSTEGKILAGAVRLRAESVGKIRHKYLEFLFVKPQKLISTWNIIVYSFMNLCYITQNFKYIKK